VQKAYRQVIDFFGSEFSVLLFAKPEELYKNLDRLAADAVLNIRRGNVERKPGYDGVYGRIQLHNAPGEDIKMNQGELVHAAG
jgi:PHP family Zn ribbon phosphoesterase